MGLAVISFSTLSFPPQGLLGRIPEEELEKKERAASCERRDKPSAASRVKHGYTKVVARTAAPLTTAVPQTPPTHAICLGGVGSAGAGPAGPAGARPAGAGPAAKGGAFNAFNMQYNRINMMKCGNGARYEDRVVSGEGLAGEGRGNWAVNWFFVGELGYQEGNWDIKSRDIKGGQ